MTIVLGLNAGRAASHDSSACLMRDGSVLAFIEEERVSRVRHAPGAMPIHAIQRCLSIAGLSEEDIDVVALGWDEPRLAARCGEPWEFHSAREFSDRLGLQRTSSPEFFFVPHHRAHAYSAFYASPYPSASVLIVDGNGEDESISIFEATNDGSLVRRESWPRVNSIGYMYEAVSHWLGLGRLGAGKTMGLSAYGRSNPPSSPPSWISTEGDRLHSALGSDALLVYDELMVMWAKQIEQYAGSASPALPPSALADDPLAVRISFAAQSQTEAAVMWLAQLARQRTGIDNLCIAGGVGLNCAANGRIPQPVYVPPVPHDAGVALGAAWAVTPPRDRSEFTAYTGTAPGSLSQDIEGWRLSELEVDRVIDLVLAGRVGAFCRGRSEVGPRALTHRSLLASPISSEMKSRLNTIKRREQWRPFGPVSTETGQYWQPIGDLERYMVGASELTQEGKRMLPAVCHVDGTTRPQLLNYTDEPFVHSLLVGLGRAGHPPVLVNTSFNGPDEPLVDTADDALACANRLALDYLVVGDHLLTRK